jgi:hypothetical protein
LPDEGSNEFVDAFDWVHRNGPEPVTLPVPDHLLRGLERYAVDRVPTGSFLRSVLENDLKNAVGNADVESQRALCAIVSWCYNHLPSPSWGSPEKVTKWLSRTEDE